MGEHSIIIPEARVIDRESGSRVVCKFVSRDFTAGGPASPAGGVAVVRRRRSIDHAVISPPSEGEEKRIVVGGFSARWCCWWRSKRRRSWWRGLSGVSECEEKDSKQRLKWRHPATSLSRGVVGGAPSNPSLLLRLVFLVLSLLGFARTSSTSVSTSRGPLLVSSSCALVSLLVVGLLRPSLAVPTNNFVPTAAAAAVAGNSANSDTTLTRIMLQQRERANAVKGAEEEANFESTVEATMNRRRLGLEDPTAIYHYHDDDDDDHDDDDDSLPSELLLNPRESGLEGRSRLREAELDTIRRSIVEGLGLERIPDPSKANVSQTEYRRAHQEYLTRVHARAGKDARLRRLYTFHPTEGPPATLVNRTRRSAYGLTEEDEEEHQQQRDVPTSMHPGALYFPVEIPEEEEEALVDHATLRLLIEPSDASADEEQHDIFLYRLTADSKHFVSRHKVRLDRRGPRWIELEATELASLWHEYGVENLGVELRFESSDTVRTRKQPKISEPAFNVFTTTLTMEDNDGRSSRRKRRASPEHLLSLHKGRRTECRGDNKKCCRHEMTVKFKDLEGFEFIAQPKSFDAGYCKGRCPPRYNPAHHHALLQSLIWKVDKRKAPRPCCAPSKLDELEILYFDENDPKKLKVSSWKNMKVLECACS